jgi:hypothetical protein
MATPGTRWLELDLRLLVDLLRTPAGARRRYSVEYPLPADATLWGTARVRLEVHSTAWRDGPDQERFVRPPVVRLHRVPEDAQEG